MANRDVTLRLKVEGDASGSKKALQETADQMKVLDRAAKESANNVSQAFDKAGKDTKKALGDPIREITDRLEQLSSTIMSVGVAFAGIGAAFSLPVAGAVQQAANLEHALNKVRAVADSTPEEFLKIAAAARDMGMNTTFSATQTAEGMLELAKAGYKAGEVVSAIGPILQLAAVEGRSFGETAEGTVNVLNAFGLAATDAGRVVDVLARTSNDTTSSMASLGEGFKHVAPLAANMGLTVEQTAAYLGVLSNNAIKGEMAGTGLRRVMAILADPTREASSALRDLGVDVVKQQNGVIDLAATLTKLRDANMTAADAMKIFGLHGANEAVVLAKNIDQVDKFTKRNDNATGSLKEMYTITNSGLIPTLTMAKNALIGLGDTLGSPLLAPLKLVVGAFTSVIQGVNWLAATFPKATFVIMGLVGVVGVAAIAIGGLMLSISGLLMGASALNRGWRLLVKTKEDGIMATLRNIATMRTEQERMEAFTITLQKNTAERLRNQRLESGLPAKGVAPPTGGVSKGLAVAGAVSGAAGGIMMLTDAETTAEKAAGATTMLGGVLTALPNKYAQVAGAIFEVGGASTFMASKMGLISSSEKEAEQAMDKLKDSMLDYIKRGSDLSEFASEWKKNSGKDLTKGQEEAFTNLKALNDASAENTFETQNNMVRDIVKAYTSAGVTFKQFGVDFQKAFGKPPDALIEASFTKQKEQADKLAEAQKKAAAGDKSALMEIKAQEAYKVQAANKSSIDAIEKGMGRALADFGGNIDSFAQDWKNYYGKDMPAAVKEGFNKAKGIIDDVKGKKLGFEEELALIKTRYEVEAKLIENLSKQKSATLKADQETIRGNISASIQSEQLRANALQQMEITFSQQRMDLAKNDYDFTTSMEQAKYAETKKQLEKQRDSATQQAQKDEAKTKLIELDKSYTESSIANQQKLTDTINSELDKQLQKRTEYMAKVVTLEQQIKDSQRATADAIRSVNETAGSSYEKLTSKIEDARKKTAEAVALSSAFPEKALEFAKQAQQAWSSMAQSVDSTKTAIRNAALATRDAKIDLMKSDPTLTQVDKYQIAVQQLQNTINEAKRLEKEGRRDEAIAAYKQAQDQSKGLAGEAPEGLKGEVIAQGVALIDQMGAKQQELLNQKLVEEERINKEAKENIDKMGNLITATLSSQIDQTKQLIDALNVNTAALRGKLAEQKQPGTPGTSGAATDTGGATWNATKGTWELASTAPGMPQTSGGLPQAQQAVSAATAQGQEVAKAVENVIKPILPSTSTIATSVIPNIPQDTGSISIAKMLSPEYQDEWRRANAPNAAQMLKYDYEAAQRTVEDPAKERERLLEAAKSESTGRDNLQELNETFKQGIPLLVTIDAQGGAKVEGAEVARPY